MEAFIHITKYSNNIVGLNKPSKQIPNNIAPQFILSIKSNLVHDCNLGIKITTNISKIM